MNLLLSKKSGHIDPTRDHVVTGRECYYPELLPFPCRALRNDKYLYIKNYRLDRCIAGNPPDYKDSDGGISRKYLWSERAQGSGRFRWELAYGMRPAEEFYDLSKDPDQMHNVASDKQYSELVEMLGKQLERELVQNKDPRAMGQGDIFDSYPARIWDSVKHAPMAVPPDPR